MASSKKLVLVAGNIGVGKTSLTERIGEKLNWRTTYEVVATNPYLPDFYKDMGQWGFHLQVYFLGTRAQQHIVAANDPRSAILDRSIYEDFYIFSRALRHMGNFNERDFEAYHTIFDVVIQSLPTPDLLLFLRAPVDVLLERIRMRARDIESSIDPDYLALLGRFYDEWMDDFDLCPVLTVPAGELDFVAKPHHLDVIIGYMQDKLAGKEDVIFPPNGEK
ncbi:MAG: deoxynucleoside kinase [Anaerolineales bacterium]|nr:deoxynucleoside kinase [Anaerolineales bacterium]